MTNPPVSPFTRGAVFAAPCLVAALCSHGQLQAALVNAGFESGDLTGWSSLGTISVSTGMDYGDNVALSPGANRVVSPNPGSYLAHLVAEGSRVSDIARTMGLSEAALDSVNTTPGFETPGFPPYGSLLYQTLTASSGESFTFNWNFVERDFLDFNDWSFFGVSFNGAPAEVKLLSNVAQVGPEEDAYSENTTVNGWKSFNYQAAAPGDYTFYFGVLNVGDDNYDSELWVDAPQSMSPIPEPGSVLGLGLLLGSGLFVRSRRRTAQPGSV